MKKDLYIKAITTLIAIIGSLLAYYASMIKDDVSASRQAILEMQMKINTMEMKQIIFAETGKWYYSDGGIFDMRDSLANEFENDSTGTFYKVNLLLKLVELTSK